MGSKIVQLGIIWLLTVFVYIILAVCMPAINELVGVSSAALDASANMTQFPGTKEGIETFPVYVFFIPGFVGIVTTVIMLKRD